MLKQLYIEYFINFARRIIIKFVGEISSRVISLQFSNKYLKRMISIKLDNIFHMNIFMSYTVNFGNWMEIMIFILLKRILPDIIVTGYQRK